MNKNLLVLSVAAAALASSASAAVSSNIVGYVKLNLRKGLSLIANPLNNTAPTGNNISSLFASLGDLDVYSWNGTSYDTTSFFGGAIVVGPDVVLAPGTSLFVELPEAKTLTLVGDALTGTQTKSVGINNTFAASKIPISGTATELGLVPTDGSTVFKWDGSTYVSYDYADGIGWPSGEPSIAVGEGVIIYATTPFTWTKTFTVAP